MSDVYRFLQGDQPLLISVPHDGRDIPTKIRARMTAAGRAIPDTDWHVAQLYEFATALGASMIAANYSRYVVDLNRATSDGNLYPGQVATGLCPVQTFSGDEIYVSGDVSTDEKMHRIEKYWSPYHDKIGSTLRGMHAEHGHALLWDAHSIGSLVPRLFEGELPILNLGSNDSKSCSQNIENSMLEVLTNCPYSSVVNGRFKGGHITRNFGDPSNNVHALQLEIAQRAYMDEATTVFDDGKAEKLRETLRNLLQAYLNTTIQ